MRNKFLAASSYSGRAAKMQKSNITIVSGYGLRVSSSKLKKTYNTKLETRNTKHETSV